MTLDFKTAWGRFRVRLKTILAAAVIAIPAILDQLGMIDLTPIFTMLFGYEKGARVAAVVSAIFFVLRFVTSGPVIERLKDDHVEDSSVSPERAS